MSDPIPVPVVIVIAVVVWLLGMAVGWRTWGPKAGQKAQARRTKKHRDTEKNFGRRIENALRTFADEKFSGEFEVSGDQRPEGYTVKVVRKKYLAPWPGCDGESIQPTFEVRVDAEASGTSQLILFRGVRTKIQEVESYSTYMLSSVDKAIEDASRHMKGLSEL